MTIIFTGGSSPDMSAMLSRLLQPVDSRKRAPNQPHTAVDGLPAPGGRLVAEVANLQSELRSWGIDVPADYGRSAAAEVYARHVAELYHLGGKLRVDAWLSQHQEPGK